MRGLRTGVQPGARTSDHLGMYIYRAEVVLPTSHHQRATSDLRRELGRQAAAEGAAEHPDWTTLDVEGPVEVFDRRGDIRFRYRASVAVRNDRERRFTRR